LPAATQAQNSPKASSLSVSPVIYDIPSNPGDTITNKIKVSNALGTQPIAVEMEVKPFTGTETGEALILEKDNPAYSLGQWITLSPSEFVLDPKETQLVTYTIRIPLNAEAGGRYASILAKSAEGSVSGTGAATVQKVGSLVLLKVSGSVSYSAVVKDFKTIIPTDNPANVDSKSSFEKSPIGFFTNISNTGKSHIKPSGFIVISNMFGKKVADVPFPEKIVLPGNDRLITAGWEGAKIGYYTATLLLNYGDKNEQLTATTTFLVFPWKTGVPIILGTLIVLWFLIARRKRFGKALAVIFGRH
jgi:hypothetical protein